MSRHHMLPPILSALPPQPKKIETRKRRIQVGATDETDEAGEAQEAPGFGQATAAGSKLPPQNFTAIEGAEQKPQHPRGRLSESTLKVMLEAQELQ